MKCDFCDKKINQDFYITEFGYFVCPTCNGNYKDTLYFENKKQAINYFVDCKKNIEKIPNKKTMLMIYNDLIKRMEGD